MLKVKRVFKGNISADVQRYGASFVEDRNYSITISYRCERNICFSNAGPEKQRAEVGGTWMQDEDAVSCHKLHRLRTGAAEPP